MQNRSGDSLEKKVQDFVKQWGVRAWTLQGCVSVFIAFLGVCNMDETEREWLEKNP